MIRYQEALALLLDSARERGLRPHQTIPLEDAVGRTASTRIFANDALPPFDNSSMDGYAVASRAASGRATLPVVATLAAGDAAPCAAQPGAVEVMTGAPIPPGCDTILPVEVVERSEKGEISFEGPVEAGDYVRKAGSDYAKDDVVVEGGTVLEPRHLMALAALGHARVPVRLRPRLAIISTGKEVVDYDRRPEPGQIRNATAPYLHAELLARGAQVLNRISVGDDPAAFRARLEELLDDELDLILATGGVSMGRHDFVPDVVESLGAETLFHKTAVRPGKPLLAATFGNGPLFLGLPGNPLSTAMALRFFADPVLRFFTGRAPERPRVLPLAQAVEKPEGLRCFFKGVVEDGRARCLPGQESFRIKPLLEADAWICLKEEGSALKAGDAVEVYPL